MKRTWYYLKIKSLITQIDLHADFPFLSSVSFPTFKVLSLLRSTHHSCLIQFLIGIQTTPLLSVNISQATSDLYKPSYWFWILKVEKVWNMESCLSLSLSIEGHKNKPWKVKLVKVLSPAAPRKEFLNDLYKCGPNCISETC